jgi:hypothetical protein
MFFFLWLTAVILSLKNLFYLIGLGIFLAVVYYFTSFPWLIWRLIGIPFGIFFIFTAVVAISGHFSEFFSEESFQTWVRISNFHGLVYLLSELFHWGSQTYQPVEREMINEGMGIPLLWFAVIYIVYSISSQLIFLITSGGITFFTETLIWILVFLLWLVLLGSRFYRTEKLLEPYFWKLIVGILLLQLFTSLFNPRICFSGRSHNFIQHFLYKINGGRFSDLCSVSREQISESFPFIGTEPWIPFEIVFFARVLYYILNLILILIR